MWQLLLEDYHLLQVSYKRIRFCHLWQSLEKIWAVICCDDELITDPHVAVMFQHQHSRYVLADTMHLLMFTEDGMTIYQLKFWCSLPLSPSYGNDHSTQSPAPASHCPCSAMLQAVHCKGCLPIIHNHTWTCDAIQTSGTSFNCHTLSEAPAVLPLLAKSNVFPLFKEIHFCTSKPSYTALSSQTYLPH